MQRHLDDRSLQTRSMEHSQAILQLDPPADGTSFLYFQVALGGQDQIWSKYRLGVQSAAEGVRSAAEGVRSAVGGVRGALRAQASRRSTHWGGGRCHTGCLNGATSPIVDVTGVPGGVSGGVIVPRLYGALIAQAHRA